MKIIIEVETDRNAIDGLTEASKESKRLRFEDVLMKNIEECIGDFIEKSKPTTDYFKSCKVIKE